MGDRHGEMRTEDTKKIPRHGGVCAEAVGHSQSWSKWTQSHHTLLASAHGGSGYTEQRMQCQLLGTLVR